MKKAVGLLILAAFFAACLDAAPRDPAPRTPDIDAEPVARTPTIAYACDACWQPIGPPSLAYYDVAIDPLDPSRIAIGGRTSLHEDLSNGPGIVDSIGVVAVSEDGGASWRMERPPEGLILNGGSRVTGVAWDITGRLHAMIDRSSSIIGGDISVGTGGVAGVGYAYSDDAGASWVVETLSETGSQPQIRTSEDRLWYGWNSVRSQGDLLHHTFTNLNRTDPALEATTGNCWYPDAPVFADALHLACDNERSLGPAQGGTRWIQVTADGLETTTVTVSCPIGDVLPVALLASGCDEPTLSWRGPAGMRTITLLEDRPYVLASDLDEEGRIHVLASTDPTISSSNGAGEPERRVDHVILSPDGEILYRHELSAASAHYVPHGGRAENAILTPLAIRVASNQGYIVGTWYGVDTTMLITFSLQG